MVQKSDLENLRSEYPAGTRLRLIQMDDPYPTIKAGDVGIVTGLDDLGTIQMSWDAGSTLGLIYGVDRFEKVENELQGTTGKAIFVRKAAGIKALKEAISKGGKPESFVIEKQVALEVAEYKAFTESLLSDYDFIADNLNLMRKDRNGIYHCLLVTETGGNGGILIESDGYEYARYAAHLRG
jgi:hypothetical protein